MGSTAPPMGQPLPYQPGEYQSLSQNARVSWALDKLPPPSDLYITRDDVLAVQGTSSIGSEIINYQARILTIDGVIVPIQGQLRLGAAGVSVQTTTPLCEGFLLSLVAEGTNATQQGQTFVRAALLRSGPLFGNAALLLLGDYVSIFAPIAWPGGVPRHLVDGHGAAVTLQATQPAAGADISFGFPNGTRNRIFSIHAVLTTSATAANRNIELIFTAAAGVVWRVSAPVSIVAATTAHVNAGQSFSASAGVVPTDIVIPLPGEFYMRGAEAFTTLTTGIQAGDQWSLIFLSCEQWLDGV